MLALEDHRVAPAELVLQVLHAAEALELAVDHDAQLGGQGLALLHAVRGEDYGHAQVAGPLDHGPEVAARGRVHACRGLVQDHYARTADKADGGAHLTLVAATLNLVRIS